MSDKTTAASGGCYCGKVRYRAARVETEVVECHCSQCRKQAGHRNASVDTTLDDVEIDGAENLTWFRASPAAERGFCSVCGSHLFWRATGNDELAIQAASIDEPTGLRLARHIFVEDKGDYYEIADGLPRFAGYDRPLDQD